MLRAKRSMAESGPSSIWVVIGVQFVVYGSLIFVMYRKRRWLDWKPLKRAAIIPPGHLPDKPKKVRDLRDGESGYVPRYKLTTSRLQNRTYVSWTAEVEFGPERRMSTYGPVRITRLKNGFRLALPKGMEISSGLRLWGEYAPVVEIVEEEPAG